MGRLATNQEQENTVIKWFIQFLSSGENKSGVNLQKATTKFADKLGMENFKASDGWLSNFQNHHGLLVIFKSYNIW